MSPRAIGAVCLWAVFGAASGDTARAGVVYVGGTVFYTHDLAVGTTADGSVFSTSDSAISNADNLSRLSYTLNRSGVLIGGQAGNTSSATARAGFVSNSTTATIALKSGTGVSQVDPPGGTSWPYSELKIDFRDANPLRWGLTDPGFGPPASKYASITIGGTVGSESGSFARCFVNLAIYKNSISGANQLATIVLDSGTLTTPGTFSKTLTSSGAFSSTPTASDDLLMIGTILFQANNGGTPTDVSLLNASFGTAVNTNSSTYVGPANGSWFTQANWSTNDDGINPPAPAVIPNGIDHRASFPSDLGLARSVTLNGNVTLGVLESAGSAVTTIQSDGTSSLTLTTQSEGRTTIWQHSDNGESTLIFDTNVVLASNGDPFALPRMEVINDSTNPIVFNHTLSGPGDARFVKSGAGPMHVNGTMSFSNEPSINEGELKVNGTVVGSLPLYINNGASLSGTGTVQQPVSVNFGGVVSPGNSIGTLNVGEIYLGAGAAYLLELDVVSPTPSADQIAVASFVSLDSATLQFKFVPAAPTPGPFTPQSFVIVNNNSGGAVFGEFDGLMDDVIATAGLIAYSVNYDGGDGNDVVLTIHSVPEPGSAGAAAAAIAALSARRRRVVR